MGFKRRLENWINRIQPPPPDDLVNVASHVRDEWIREKAEQLKPGMKVLDAGAGECPYRNLFRHCDYKAQDFAQYSGTTDGLLKEAWVYGQIDYVCDITQIPVPDNSFDAILCSEVIEHLPEPISALKELSRIIVPGGKMFLTAPLGSGLHQQPYHFYGGFTPHFYREILSRYGMEVEEIRPICGLMKNVGQETHRVGRILSGILPDSLPTVFVKAILMNWLPNYLARMESRVFIEEFAIGYLVEAKKRN